MVDDQDDLVVRRGDEDYRIRQSDGALRIGQTLDDSVQWLDVDVPLSELSAGARQGWEDRDPQNSALATAVDGIISAAANRGG
jgi:hypothetical protein